MKNFLSLKILDKFRFLYEKLGVDYDDMRLILSTKLTMDSRKASNLLNNQQGKESSNQNKKMLGIYVFYGLLMMVMVLVGDDILMSMTLYFTMIMIFLITIFMSDFSSVILDVKDKGILATRGISLKTLNASKITHVMIYIISISMALSGFSLIASFKYGFTFFIVFLIEILIIDIFMIIISGLIYLLVLKLFDGEKLKDALSIIQIGLSMVFFVAYFLIINIGNSMSFLKDIKIGVISYFLPPFWFAAPLEMIATGNKNQTLLILSLLALVVPIISFLIYMKLTPVFEKNLQKLNNESSSKSEKKHNITMKLSGILCRDREERIFFNFVSNIIRNDRDFKYRVYPSLGATFILPIIMIFSNKASANSHVYLFLYFSALIPSTIIVILKYSKNYKASYIYKTINIKNKMSVHKAAIKACIIDIIIPFYLIQSIFFMYFYKVSIIQHLVVIFLVIIFMYIISFIMLDKNLPFSCEFKAVKSGEGLVEGLLLMGLIGIMAGIHFAISSISILALNIYIIAILIVNIVLSKLVFKMK